MSGNQRTGRAARRVPTDRFKRLEKQVRDLKKKQLRRRAGREFHESVDEHGNKQIRVVRLDKIDPVPVKRVLAPVVIPARLDDDLEYVERRFPKAAKNRRMLNETNDEIERLREDLVAMTKDINVTNASISRAEDHRNHLQRKLDNMLFQDDIMQRRQERGRKIQELKDRLQNSEEQAKELSRYTRTLRRMMERIGNEQVTYERTMESYMLVLDAQKDETEEIKELARRMKYLRHVTQRKLVQKREELFDNEATTEDALTELRQVAQARQSIEEQFAQIKAEKHKKKQMQQRNKRSSQLLDSWQRNTNSRKMQDVEEELEDLMDKFRRIELVTGLKTEAAIVHRYFHQDEYCREMEQKVVFLRGQIAKANARARKLRSLQDNEKYFGKSHQSSRQSQIEVERITDKLTALRSRSRKILEENRRYAGYVLSAAQSLRHMANVVESSDAKFADKPATRDSDNQSQSPQKNSRAKDKSGELTLTVNEVETLTDDLQSKVNIILHTLFPGINGSPIASPRTEPPGRGNVPLFNKNAVTAKDQARIANHIMRNIYRNTNNVRVDPQEDDDDRVNPLSIMLTTFPAVGRLPRTMSASSVSSMKSVRSMGRLLGSPAAGSPRNAVNSLGGGLKSVGSSTALVGQPTNSNSTSSEPPSPNGKSQKEETTLTTKQLERRHEAKLKRQSMTTGIPMDQMREIYDVIPRQHKEEVLDRRSLKESAFLCERKARKREKKWQDFTDTSGRDHGLSGRTSPGHPHHGSGARRQLPSVDDDLDTSGPPRTSVSRSSRHSISRGSAIGAMPEMT